MKKVIILFFLLIVIIQSSYATNILGGEITYRNIGPSKYEVTISLIRDCNGINPATTYLYASGDSAQDTISVYQLNKISVKDITGITPNCGDSSRCKGGSSPFGFEQHVWVAELDLSGFSSCNWTLGYGQCCRSSAITTGAAGSNFYQTAYLNNCLAVQNSSPVFNETPNLLLCQGDVSTLLKFSALDTVDVGDSLSYDLVQPLTSDGTYTNWTGQFSYIRPLTFWGFPAHSIGWPAGFHISYVNGNVQFRPMVKDQVSIISVEVIDWRRIGGVMRKIGSIRREITVFVLDCADNGLPIIDVDSLVYSCIDNELCINVGSSHTKDDSVRLSWSALNPGMFATYGSDSLKYGESQLRWTPDSSHLRSEPYNVVVSATDKGCIFGRRVDKLVSIFVGSKPQATLSHDLLGCGRIAIWHQPLDSAIYHFSYSILDNNGKVHWNGVYINDTAWLSPGNYRLLLYLESGPTCLSIIEDSFTIANYVQVDLGNDLRFCPGDSVALNADITLGRSPFQISWYMLGDSILLGSGSTNFFAKPQANQAYTVWVKDDEGCLDIDTIQLRLHEFKDNNLDSLYYLCENETLTVTPIDDPSKLIWNWSTGDTSKTIDITRSGSYWLQIEDSNGCTWVETFQVQGIEVKPVVSGNLTVCKSDSVYLLVANADSFVWYNSNMAIIGTDSFIRLNTTPDAIHLRSYRSVGSKTCSDFQTFEIKNYDSIPLWIEGDNWVQKGVTHNYSAKGVGYNQYQWTTIGGQIESGQFTSVITASWQDTGVRDLILYSTDSNGCRVQLNKEINIGLTSIKSIKQENINLYPNPGKGLYTLEYSGNDLPQRYVIINALGQQVEEGNLNGRINKIDIESQKAGMYLLILEDGPRIILIKE